MKYLFFLFIILTKFSFAQNLQDYKIVPIEFNRVKLNDSFWLPRIETNRKVTIPASFARCESTGRLSNFVMAAKKEGKFCTTYPFDDTDIYKTIEGASYSLATYHDKKLDKYLDSLIGIIGNAQEADGYLYTARTIDPLHPHNWAGKQRWEKERELSHELYNAGHLYEAAAAHYMATNKKTLLNIAIKNADLICSVFGEGKLTVAPGHEIVEMGLVRLYRITGKKDYLNLAKFFIEARGHYDKYDVKSNDPWKNGAYWQDNKPVVNQTEAVGHAVRAAYLYSAVADVAAITGDKYLLSSVDQIWENVVGKKMYIQGGIGAVPSGERFGDNYELPNATAYNETCAAIADVFWNHRMFLLHGDSKYIDILEKTLYNGLISGVGLDGKSFFYTNAMQITNNFSHKEMEPERSGWFECSCCPTNMTRLIPSIPGYIYAQQGANIYVNLFINSNTSFEISEQSVLVSQQNNYPWNGNLQFSINPESIMKFNLLIRIPGWANDQAMPSDLYRFEKNSSKPVEIKINGTTIDYVIEKGYAVLKRNWKPNDKVEVILPMEVRKVVSSKHLVENKGKVALQRGPLIYCAEWVDNDGLTSNIILPRSANFSFEFKKDLFGGVIELSANADKVVAQNGKVKTKNTVLKAIPYYAWANRGKGEMQVWFPTAIAYAAFVLK